MLTQTQKTNVVLSVLIALVACLPATGFVYGMATCKDCGGSIFGQTLGRIFIGLVGAVLTSITFGKPWDNEAGTTSTNLRIYVVLAFLLIAAGIYFWRRAKA